MTLRTPTVKERILLHLLDFAKFAGAYEVPLDITQDGISQAAWIDVHHVVQYVRPLAAEGLVLERTAHVRGRARRRKVYELTNSGRLKGYGLRDALKAEAVLVRGPGGLEEATLDKVLQSAGGNLSVLDALRQFVLTGFVDLKAAESPEVRKTVRILADAPSVEDFVGRQRELREITDGGKAWRVVVIRGVAGIGKSTLAARACELMSGTHHIFWHRVRSWDTPQSVLVGLAGFLSAIGKPSLRAALKDGPPETTLRILRQDLVGIKALLVLDDAQETGEDLLSLLRFLKDAAASIPETRLLVLTRRALPFYDRRDVVLESAVREIDLGGLEAPDAHALLGSGELERLPDVGGHPLLLKLLRSAPPGAVQTRALQDAHRFIKETIYEELPESARKLLKLGSLYRVPVTPEALLRDPGSSRSELDALVDRSLITVASEGRLGVHDSVRAFFLELLTDAERKELGSFAAKQLFAHAKRAEETGDVSLSMASLFNAIEVAPSESDAVAVIEALGDAQERTGDYQGARANFRRALKAGGEPRDRVRLHRKLASLQILRGDLTEAAMELERGFGTLGLAVNGERAWLHYARCCLAIRLEQWEEAIEDGKVAMDLFQVSGDVLGEGRALYQLAHAEVNRPKGSAESAKRYLEAALALSETVRDPSFLATVHSEHAYLLAYRLGAVEPAMEHLAAVEALILPGEVSYTRANFLMLKGLIDLWFRADFPEAVRDFQEAMALAEQLDNKATSVYAKYALAHADFYQGRVAEARQTFERLIAEFQGLGAVPFAVDAACVAAECSLLLEDLDGFQRMMDRVGEGGSLPGRTARPILVRTFEALGRFLAGDRQTSRSLLQEILSEREGGFPERSWISHFVYSVLLKAIGADEEAAEHRQTAVSILESSSGRADLGSLAERERLLLRVLKKANPTGESPVGGHSRS